MHSLQRGMPPLARLYTNVILDFDLTLTLQRKHQGEPGQCA
jgi:hypothetical protein